MEFWKKLSVNEKAMLAFVLALILGIFLSWNRISEGIKNGFTPYLKEKPANSK